MAERRSKKREAIQSAAKELFCAEGYTGTSVDAIAARANVSKATVYAHFASKDALFSHLLGVVADSYVGLTSELLALPVADGLRHLARRYVDLLLQPEALCIYRTLITQGPQFPDMVKAWEDGGPRRVLGTMAQYLTLQNERGTLNVPDPDLTARLFLHAVRGEPHSRALTGSSIWSDDCGRFIDEAVRMVLATYGVPRE